MLKEMKRIVRPFVPVGLINMRNPIRNWEEEASQAEAARRLRFEGLCASVGQSISAISDLSAAQCLDARFLENEFIPSLGLNDENLEEQPDELANFFGKRLHIFQYPNQLAPYLVWLANNAGEVTSYMEIGCRWGGMFILVSEWLRRHGAQLRAVTAIDLIEPTPFIETYFALLLAQETAGASPPTATYIRDSSTSPGVKRAVDRIRPDFVFIDGDHTMRGALSDHILIRNHARIVAHHDIASQSCPDTRDLWQYIKELESNEFDFYDFDCQYSSVNGNFFGIGAMKRK